MRYRYLLLPLLSLFSALFFLVLLEAGLQAYKYLKPRNNSTFMLPSLCCGIKLKKNHAGPPYKIDHRGFRKSPMDFSGSPAKDVYQIVMMGDSVTFGFTNANFLDYPAYLEFILNSSFKKVKLPDDKKFIDVINAGIPTQTIFYLKNYLKDSILKIKPDMVIISGGFTDSVKSSSSQLLMLLEQNVQLLYWYLNNSETFLFLNKYLLPLVSKIKSREPCIDKKIDKINKNNLDYLAYKENLKEIVTIIKEKKIIPVLMPWPMMTGKNTVKELNFDETKTEDKQSVLKYKLYTEVMRDVSMEFNVPFIRTPFQLPWIPEKYNTSYFTTDNLHLNNYGAKIISLSIANAIYKILEGKNNEEIYSGSFASKPHLDFLDVYVFVMLNVEPSGLKALQKAIQTIEKGIADDCIKYTKEDMSLENHHFSECFFSIPDTALYLIRKRNYESAKHYIKYAVKRYPKLAYPFFIYGLYQLELGNYNEAESHFKKAVKLAPFFKTPQNYLERLQHIEKQ